MRGDDIVKVVEIDSQLRTMMFQSAVSEMRSRDCRFWCRSLSLSLSLNCGHFESLTGAFWRRNQVTTLLLLLLLLEHLQVVGVVAQLGLVVQVDQVGVVLVLELLELLQLELLLLLELLELLLRRRRQRRRRLRRRRRGRRRRRRRHFVVVRVAKRVGAGVAGVAVDRRRFLIGGAAGGADLQRRQAEGGGGGCGGGSGGGGGVQTTAVRLKRVQLLHRHRRRHGAMRSSFLRRDLVQSAGCVKHTHTLQHFGYTHSHTHRDTHRHNITDRVSGALRPPIDTSVP